MRRQGTANRPFSRRSSSAYGRTQQNRRLQWEDSQVRGGGSSGRRSCRTRAMRRRRRSCQWWSCQWWRCRLGRVALRIRRWWCGWLRARRRTRRGNHLRTWEHLCVGVCVLVSLFFAHSHVQLIKASLSPKAPAVLLTPHQTRQLPLAFSIATLLPPPPPPPPEQ